MNGLDSKRGDQLKRDLNMTTFINLGIKNYMECEIGLRLHDLRGAFCGYTKVTTYKVCSRTNE